MNVLELTEKTGWGCIAAKGHLDKEIKGAYCGDLLSWVMGNGEPDQAWITVQVHMNIVAGAQLREFSCVLIADGANPPADVIARASDEGLPMIATGLSEFETARRLIELGI